MLTTRNMLTAEAIERKRAAKRRDYLKHREARLRSVAEYQRAHPESNREASRRYRARNKEKRRDTILRYRYKLSAVEFDAMVERQGGRCMACGVIPKRFYVDHNHSCCANTPTCGTCTRGLVCNGCNTYDRLSEPWLDKVGRSRGRVAA